MRPLSDELVEQGRVLRVDYCMNWTQIAKRLGLRTPDGIRRRLDLEYQEKRNQAAVACKKQNNYIERRRRPELTPQSKTSYHRGAGNVAHGGRAVPPPHVIEEAMRVATAELTLSMMQFGDPPPGRSALDRMRAS
jgi:hypothetical protein